MSLIIAGKSLSRSQEVNAQAEYAPRRATQNLLSPASGSPRRGMIKQRAFFVAIVSRAGVALPEGTSPIVYMLGKD
jgi:hypothetical protein